MPDTTLIAAETPGGKPIAIAVVDLDGTADLADDGGEEQVAWGRKSLAGALDAVKDFSASLRDSLKVATPDRTTVEFTIGFAMQSGTLTALFVDGKADGTVTVTLEWGKDQ